MAALHLQADETDDGEALGDQGGEAAREEARQPDAGIVVRDLGKDHDGGDDQEGQGPGPDEAQGRTTERAQGRHAVGPGRLEQEGRQRRDAEGGGEIAGRQRDDPGELSLVDADADQGDQDELDDADAAREHHRRQQRRRGRTRQGLGGRHCLGRARLGLGAGSPGRIEQVTDIEGAHGRLSEFRRAGFGGSEFGGMASGRRITGRGARRPDGGRRPGRAGRRRSPRARRSPSGSSRTAP